MSERWITIPPPAEFLDAHTKDRITRKNVEGESVVLPDRTFDWFMHVYILSHLQFSMTVGGYDAVKAAKQIAKSMEAAMDKGELCFAVSADQWRRMNCCIAKAEDKHSDERLKEKPNLKILHPLHEYHPIQQLYLLNLSHHLGKIH